MEVTTDETVQIELIDLARSGMDPNKLYTYNELAPALGVTPKTVASYHRRSKNLDYPKGLFPPPSKVIEGKYPRWKWRVVERWDAQRPGPGWHVTKEDGREPHRLTHEDEVAVQQAWSNGTATRQELAETFGVSYTTIYRVTSR